MRLLAFALLVSAYAPARAFAAACAECWDDSCPGLAAAGAPACEAPEAATVSFTGPRAGAVVLVDGRPRGTTPIAKLALEPGDHFAALQADACHRAVAVPFTIDPGETRAIALVEAAETASVVVLASDGSLQGRVEVDGADVGVAPGPFQVDACARELRLTTTDGRSGSSFLSLHAGSQAAILVTVPAPPPAAAPAGPARMRMLEWTCREGIGRSCTTLGAAYSRGEFVRRDEVLAADLFLAGCRHGDLAGCLERGRRREQGFGVVQDVGEAQALYRTACRGGLEAACEEAARLAGKAEGARESAFSAAEAFGYGPALADHVHLFAGWGRNTVATEGGWQLSLLGLADRPSVDRSALVALSYERLGGGVDGRAANLALSFVPLGMLGPVRLGGGPEVDLPLLVAGGGGPRVGATALAGLSLPLGPIHAFVAVRYRAFGRQPTTSGWFFDLYATPEALAWHD